jgi:hypothetical protein
MPKRHRGGLAMVRYRDGGNGRFHCDCGVGGFEQRADLFHHYYTCPNHANTWCRDCSCLFSSESHYTRHMVDIHHYWICDDPGCDRLFINKRGLQQVCAQTDLPALADSLTRLEASESPSQQRFRMRRMLPTFHIDQRHVGPSGGRYLPRRNEFGIHHSAR